MDILVLGYLFCLRILSQKKPLLILGNSTRTICSLDYITDDIYDYFIQQIYVNTVVYRRVLLKRRGQRQQKRHPKSVFALLQTSSLLYNQCLLITNNQCLLVVFSTGLLLPFYPVIEISVIPMQYAKQLHLHLRAIARYYYWHPSPIIITIFL